MKLYLELLQDVVEHGVLKSNRTGIDSIAIFGRQLRFDLANGFPLLTTKRLHFKSIVHELLWFLRGDTNTKYLREHGVTIWDEWATENGALGPIYGYQWVSWPGRNGQTINQIAQIVQQLQDNPNSRRILFHAWNPEDLPNENVSPQENVITGKMALAPCHVLYQFYVAQGKLSAQVYIRSSDVFLGLPYNIASLALLTHMLAQQASLNLGEIILSLGDTHIYTNHLEQAQLQLSRKPQKLPNLLINYKPENIFAYTFDSFTLMEYNSYPHIPAKVAI